MATAILGFAGCGDRDHEAARDAPIVIGWTAWDDAEFVTRLARRIIEDHTDHPVQLKLAGIEKQYRGVASGRLDAMLMAWLPDTHARYWKRYRDRLVDLGPLYEGGRLGWIVPDYVPRARVNSIADLADPTVAQRMGHRIQGIDPGAGLMQLSHEALQAYGLSGEYRLAKADAHIMARALAHAESDHQWIVVTGWTPHWIFAKWRLRFLSDPKNALGSSQHVDAIVRDGFRRDYPKVANILSAMHLSLAELQAGMFDAQQHGYPTAIDHFVATHHAEIASWVAAGRHR
ncbi:glycine betaine ABC transporter substrate-binding protein [Salinisphaera hydrothermalis]|uniref:glycine betaine ABC transporter substrate-binding protein n=1 Tax=Salinisphaera hydrothermalis TaxID=563188 RepID=UPI00334249A7